MQIKEVEFVGGKRKVQILIDLPEGYRLLTEEQQKYYDKRQCHNYGGLRCRGVSAINSPWLGAGTGKFCSGTLYAVREDYTQSKPVTVPEGYRLVTDEEKRIWDRSKVDHAQFITETEIGFLVLKRVRHSHWCYQKYYVKIGYNPIPVIECTVTLDGKQVALSSLTDEQVAELQRVETPVIHAVRGNGTWCTWRRDSEPITLNWNTCTCIDCLEKGREHEPNNQVIKDTLDKLRG